ncbi:MULTISPECIES: acyltransferase [Paraburkholderia]|uniref:acyltransferase family protein n=1 Tax=Paraburkholderia TaxID=1822464 RepID=UPI002255103E|nr:MULTISPECIES: acyltransferase [Paraburkholderia]MCX4159969.1 acyltransferase [Paraburkholderia megapolitana]
MIPQNRPNSQWTVLAGLRFILALCVVITHSGIVAPGYFLWRHVGNTGYPAVFGFFMISGYSIAASLISKPSGYFWRRVRRIYPTYIVALLFSTIVLLPHPLHLPLGQVIVLSNWQTILSNIFMMQGTLTQSVSGDGAVWSLSVEWWCYMLAIVLIRYSVKWTSVLIGLSFAALMIYMRSKGYLVGDSHMPLGLDFLLLAWAWMTGFSFYRAPTKINFALMLILPVIMFDMGDHLPLASVTVAATAAIVYLSSEIHIKNDKINKCIKWLGDMSYPLYLLHPPLLYWLSSEASIRNGNVLIISIVLIVSISYYVGSVLMNKIEPQLRHLISGSRSEVSSGRTGTV